MSNAEANGPQFGVERVISLLKNKIHEVLAMQRKNVIYLRKTLRNYKYWCFVKHRCNSFNVQRF